MDDDELMTLFAPSSPVAFGIVDDDNDVHVAPCSPPDFATASPSARATPEACRPPAMHFPHADVESTGKETVAPPTLAPPLSSTPLPTLL